ncbi:MAG: methyltransferase domain-containing protein [Acidimicrobiia bacterium]|nr:methyltransferase domain-containing protein [Acidimicrobiia bacterium]
MNRSLAAQIVGRVMRSGAYSNVLVQSETRDLEARDAGHVRFLVFGTLRHLVRVDRVIRGYSKRPRIDPNVLDVLRVGAFELLETDSPPHAVVNDAVEAAGTIGGPKAKGFVNGLLRSIERFGDPAPGDRVEIFGFDPEVLQMLDEAWGEDVTGSFMAASLEPAATVARRRHDRVPVGDLQAVSDVPGAYLVGTDMDPADWAIQDAASIVVGSSVVLEGQGPILDMAAAPGGKALHLFDRLEDPGRLILADAHPRRIDRARKRLRKSGWEGTWVLADGRKSPFADHSFDSVLLDAPCTGLGTLRRRPEIKLRVNSVDVRRMAAIQAAMIQEAVRITRPGGTVLYSVCTVTAAETIDQVSDLPARSPDNVPGIRWGNGTLLGPHLTGTDGMFVSCIDVPDHVS